MKEFKRMAARAHQKFFEKRGMDADAMRFGSFDAGFGWRGNS